MTVGQVKQSPRISEAGAIVSAYDYVRWTLCSVNGLLSSHSDLELRRDQDRLWRERELQKDLFGRAPS